MWPPCRSIDGISMSESHRDVLVAKVSLQLADARVRIMENRCGQRRVGAAAREHVVEMIESAGTARGDDRDLDRAGDGSRHLAVEARTRAVAIHRRQQDLAGAAR